MKYFALLLLLIPMLSHAQDDADKEILKDTWTHYRWEIGVNGGVNITGVNGLSDTAGTVVNSRGRLYGLTVVYHISRFFAFKTAFDFENKGWTVNDYSLTTSGGTGASFQDIQQKLNYFDIPAFFHVGFGKRLKFDLNFGPYIAFLTEAKAFYNDPSGAEIPVTDANFNNYESFDWGLTYGGGLDFALGKRLSVGFDLLYQQGIKEIHANGLKNTSLDFDFGINFLFGEKKKKAKFL